MIKVTRRCLRALDMWGKTLVLVSGPGAGSSLSPRNAIATDASLTGWGAVMSGHPAVVRGVVTISHVTLRPSMVLGPGFSPLTGGGYNL